jgi:hypothetical protein
MAKVVVDLGGWQLVTVQVPAWQVRRQTRAQLLGAATILGLLAVSASAADRQGAILFVQQGASPTLIIAPTIVAEPGSEVRLPISVSPPESVPQKSFLGVWGLPPTVSLTEGQFVGAGSWAVPIAALPRTKAIIPQGLSTQTELVVSLFGKDGQLVAQAKTTLLVRPPPAPAPAPKPAEKPGKAPADPPASGEKSDQHRPDVPPSVSLTAEERARAEELVAEGDRYFAEGKIAGARLFFKQAADARLALGAMRLAATYDPAELSALKVLGVSPDLAEARKWYERARELGASEAEDRLKGLPTD